MAYILPIFGALLFIGLISFLVKELIVKILKGQKISKKRTDEEMSIGSGYYTIEERLQALYDHHVERFEYHYNKNELDFSIENLIVPASFERCILGLSEQTSFEEKEERKKQFGYSRCNDLANDAANRCLSAFNKYLSSVDDCTHALIRGSFIIRIDRQFDDKEIKDAIVNWEPKK